MGGWGYGWLLQLQLRAAVDIEGIGVLSFNTRGGGGRDLQSVPSGQRVYSGCR